MRTQTAREGCMPYIVVFRNLDDDRPHPTWYSILEPETDDISEAIALRNVKQANPGFKETEVRIARLEDGPEEPE
jgi:hypothetical protein